MSRRYTADQLYAAMLDLVGEGSLRDRVYAALMNTHALKSTPEDFPDPDDRHKWAELQERITGMATTTSDRKAAYRTWVDSDGSELATVAQEFLALFSSAAQELGADNEERKGGRHRSVRNSIIR